MVVKTAVLKELETLYAKSGNQLCVLYGRPDLEKELLLKTFLQNKKAFYYRARYASPESQKQMMAEALEEKLQVRLQKYDYEEYFNRIKSGGPEKQEPVTSTKNIEITLPDDERESVEVRITVDGKEVYKNDVSTEQGSFYVPVTGSGVMEICIYFDGSLEKRYSENFNE